MVILSPDTPDPHDGEAVVVRHALVLAWPDRGAPAPPPGRRAATAQLQRDPVRVQPAVPGRHRAATPASVLSTLVGEVLGGWGTTVRASVVMAVVLAGAALSLFAAFGAGGVAPLVALILAHQRLCGHRRGERDTVDDGAASSRSCGSRAVVDE
jgi:hypothetical protein